LEIPYIKKNRIPPFYLKFANFFIKCFLKKLTFLTHYCKIKKWWEIAAGIDLNTNPPIEFRLRLIESWSTGSDEVVQSILVRLSIEFRSEYSWSIAIDENEHKNFVIHFIRNWFSLILKETLFQSFFVCSLRIFYYNMGVYFSSITLTPEEIDELATLTRCIIIALFVRINWHHFCYIYLSSI